jgi:surfeit locus 1 family protein
MSETRVEPRQGFPVGLTLATAIALAILVSLGVWQLQRLKWKEAILAHVAALQTAKPVDIAPVLAGVAQGRDADFTRVTATCPGLAHAPFLELYALGEGGQAGARLISACPVQAGPYRTVLVDRGFVPDDVADRPKLDPRDAAPLQVTGVLRKPDRPSVFAPKNRPTRWFTRDIAAMAAALRAPDPAPIFLYAETSTNPEFAALRPAPLPAEIPNRHFEYALTWFGLAGALACVYAAALFRRVRP